MRADDRGNVIIEFALALPILFLLLSGMIDLGRFALQKSALLQGAREGAQYGMVNSSDTSGINSTAVNATGLTGVTASNSVFCECVNGTTVSCSTTCSTSTLKKYVTVTTTKTFSSFLSLSTLSFGSFGSWTPPTSVSASVTMSVP
ncbi:MAG TPA: TadE/TadG family type IV pilus assembly protein [Reyranella sp.]|nr:TadE/TadG family type IV pilus assembly protein [Reyranella sp.]